jgi:hypothetical protein
MSVTVPFAKESTEHTKAFLVNRVREVGWAQALLSMAGRVGGVVVDLGNRALLDIVLGARASCLQRRVAPPCARGRPLRGRAGETPALPA